MKKIITAIITLLLTSTLYASSNKAMASDMRLMLDALTDMQKAAFYDDARILKRSTESLISGLDSLLKADAKDYLPKNQKHANKFAKKRAKMIKMYAEDLVISLEAGNIPDVINDYHQIQNQCISCHDRMRRRE